MNGNLPTAKEVYVETDFVWGHPGAEKCMDGIERIAAERERQIAEEGWTPEHDDEHAEGEIALAAACYAAPEPIFIHRHAETSYFSGNDGGRGDRSLQSEGHYPAWPWEARWYKPTPEDRIRELVKAGALIAAEIDRLQRLAGSQ